MSYLTGPPLNFTGKFIADVATANNFPSTMTGRTATTPTAAWLSSGTTPLTDEGRGAPARPAPLEPLWPKNRHWSEKKGLARFGVARL